jgi:arginase
MADAAYLELPYPEASVIEADTLAEQTLMLASELPDRPIVLGGCCCSHVGAIEALTAGEECLAVVWIDAHGDLNTPATSRSGNAWGMPLRMVLDDAAVLAKHVALIGARNLDPPETTFIEASGIQIGEGAVERALDGADAVYVAFDADSVEPGELAVFMPEPDGLLLEELEELFRDVASRKRIAGLGFTGLVRDPANEPKLARLATSLGL